MFTPPTRGEKLSWAAFYGLITIAGLLVLTMPPRTIDGPLGELITLAWGVFMTVAIVPTITSIKGRYKWEYAALPLVIGGILIYAATIWYLVLDTPTRAVQATLITALAIGVFRRWMGRRRLVKADKKRTIRRRDGPSE